MLQLNLLPCKLFFFLSCDEKMRGAVNTRLSLKHVEVMQKSYCWNNVCIANTAEWARLSIVFFSSHLWCYGLMLIWITTYFLFADWVRCRNKQRGCLVNVAIIHINCPQFLSDSLKQDCTGYTSEWPLKACSEIASSFISMYVIGALFAFPLCWDLRPSAKLCDVFTIALGWLKRASAWGQRKQCSCLRLFCAVTAPWQQRVIPRRRWRKGRKQLPGNEAAVNMWLWGGIMAFKELHWVWVREISMHKMIALLVKKWIELKGI